jgi:hypothetical protein
MTGSGRGHAVLYGLVGGALAASAAHAQPVTFDDLKGTTIVANVVYAQTFRRLHDGQVVTNTNAQTITLKIGTGSDIDQTHVVSITAANGRHIGSTKLQATFTLNKPQKGKFGEVVWFFDEGKLVRLQTFASGGRRVSISFKRSGGGLGCSVDAPFAREDGAGTMQTTAAVGGFKIEWLSVKQTSASCRIGKT